MTNDTHAPSARVRWARLRFQVLGILMAAPADDGELKARIEALAARAWRHPTTGESIRFSFKTIERWWYIARGAQDPRRGVADAAGLSSLMDRPVSEAPVDWRCPKYGSMYES